jgi:hypothetical protein
MKALSRSAIFLRIGYFVDVASPPAGHVPDRPRHPAKMEAADRKQFAALRESIIKNTLMPSTH